MLIRQLNRCFRIRIKRNEPFVTELEKVEYGKIVKDYRRQNIDMYWNIQSQVENSYIGRLTREL